VRVVTSTIGASSGRVIQMTGLRATVVWVTISWGNRIEALPADLSTGYAETNIDPRGEPLKIGVFSSQGLEPSTQGCST
jgi:hypothetical protein